MLIFSGKQKGEKKKKSDDEKTARSALRRSLRAIGSGSQHPAISSDADSVLRSASGVVVEAVSGGAAADLAGGIRVAATRDFSGSDALRIGDFLHRIHSDAVGSRTGYGVLRRRDRLEPLDAGTIDSLLRHSASEPAKGDSW